MNPRFCALETTGSRVLLDQKILSKTPSQCYGLRVFNRNVMKKMLPKEVAQNVLKAMDGDEKIRPNFADAIAIAMKEWAIEQGATHYTHWFQPQTGATAEKHDAFVDWVTPGEAIDKFSGSQLIQGEPDASSFPSGGLRSTYEARGYTGWDPTSPVFVWKAGDGITLCIPSVFFSWTGAVLDNKIPLLRSDRKIEDAALRLLRLTGIKANHVHSTLGLEQEYFVIDRALRNLRPDLVLAGRTVFGASSPKGQELQDHYFGSVKDRILCFMHDFELSAWELGIPLKTRHNEVAPAQHEVAPSFEKASAAVDHNILLMELMRQVAQRHELTCLLHEKPFAGLNGSGKHCNWSLMTDTGINLLDPTDTPQNNLHFLILLTAILHAVHEHAVLLRASAGSAGNDHRLGGHEAPPAIVSIYLGDALETLLDNIEKQRLHAHSGKKGKYDLGILEVPHLTKDNTDRNRTSPFAFTGNKFEFRALGSQQSPALFATAMNVIVASSLHKILDEVERNHKKDSLVDAVMPVIRKYLKMSKDVRFSGDNYSAAWVKEAKKRKLPNLPKAIEAFEAIKSKGTAMVFEGVLTAQELESRYEIQMETYAHTVNIEANLMVEMFRTQILPVAMEQQKEMAMSLSVVKTAKKRQAAFLKLLSETIEEAMQYADDLEKERDKAAKLTVVPKAKAYCNRVLPQCEKLRAAVDTLETMANDAKWPLPKYRELLFMV